MNSDETLFGPGPHGAEDADLWGHEPENSLMVVTKREEYCFLWDRDCFPELAESLLDCGDRLGERAPSCTPASDEPDLGLTADHFRSVLRELLSSIHQEL
ncbi:MAG: hypothetical protein ACYTGJ_02205 [Planctomycetota bacterium]|jgi:hypothetical protein